MWFCVPHGMAVARADLKPSRAIELGRGVEIAHRMDDVVEAARHDHSGS